jgi:hypothetical protein
LLPQGSVLGPLLYLLYSADLPTPTESTTTTFSNDTAVLAMDRDPGIASQKLQTNLDAIQKWLKKWRINASKFKSLHIAFTTQRETSPPVQINNIHLPQQEDVKYLWLHLNRRLNQHKHIFTKCKQLGMALTKMHWLHGRKSKLPSNKILIYKAILKSIWTYGIQMWGMASTSNIEILECFQSKVLRMIVDAPCYVPAEVI